MSWNRSDGKQTKAEYNRRRRAKRGLFTVSAVVLIGGAVILLTLSRLGEKTINKKEQVKPSRIAVVTPSRAPAAETDRVDVVTTKSSPAVTGRLIRAQQTQQMRTLSDGTKVQVVSRTHMTNGIERAFSTLCNPGGMAIPLSVALRRFSKEEILRIINTPMEYDKNDSEDMLARKMQIQQIKDELKGFLNDGGTLESAIAEIDRKCRRDSSYLMMMRHSMNEALATKDGEVIRAYVEKANEKLKERGMRPFEVPPRYRLDDSSDAR